MIFNRGKLVVCNESFPVFTPSGDFFFETERGDLMRVRSSDNKVFTHLSTGSIVRCEKPKIIEWIGRTQDDAANYMTRIFDDEWFDENEQLLNIKHGVYLNSCSVTTSKVIESEGGWVW